jgi:hypothetical protein
LSVATAKKRRAKRPRPLEPEAPKREKCPRAPLELVKRDPGDPLWRQSYVRMLKSNLALFAKDILGLEIGPHIEEWGELVRIHRRIAINAARDHSKTTFFSYAYPIWRAWSEPGCDVYLFSSTLDGAMEFLDTIVYGNADQTLKGMIDIPELRHLVPTRDSMRTDPRQRLNKQDIRLVNGSRLRALGYGKKIRGRHPKYIVCDDILNDEDLYSETVRRKNIAYFRSAIVNLCHPDGQIILVGTPFHVADLWGELQKNEVYFFKKYPAIIKKDGKERALFPWRWTVKALKHKLKEIGSVAFTREILCNPISDDISIFPSYLFPPLYDETFCMRPSQDKIREMGLSVYAGVDIALSASVGADYFVIFVIGVDDKGNHYLLDIIRAKGKPFHWQLAKIEWACQRYLVDLCHIESNQAQRVWPDEMKRTTDAPVKEFHTTAQNKYPLDKGIPGLRILLENLKVIIPRGDAYSIEVTDNWMTECQAFGFVDGKLEGIGAHDDTVMGWWMAAEARKLGGFGFSMGPEDEDEDGEFYGDGEGEESWEEVMLGSADERDEADAVFGT